MGGEPSSSVWDFTVLTLALEHTASKSDSTDFNSGPSGTEICLDTSFFTTVNGNSLSLKQFVF